VTTTQSNASTPIAKTACAPSAIMRDRAHRAVPRSARDELWIDEAWNIASDLRADGRADLAERLEDQCERQELVADGADVPRKRRSDAKPRALAGVARTVANGIRDGFDLERACLYAGISPEAHAAWMRLPDYRADFRAGSGGTP